MNKLLPAALALLAGAGAFGGSAHGQSLEDALAAAYRSNPTLLAQRARLRATDEQVPQALSDWRPTVQIEGDIKREKTFNSQRVSGFGGKIQYRTPRGLELNLTQNLFKGGQTLAATRQAENTVRAERARLTVTEEEVLMDAVRAFMDVFRDQAVLQLNISNEQVLRRQLEATRDRFDVGEVTRTDVFQAEARLAGATADRIQAEGDLATSRAAYRRVVGEAPGKLVEPKPKVTLPRNKAEAIRIAGVENPNVTAGVFDEKASRENVDKVTGELLPRLDLSGRLRGEEETISSGSTFVDRSVKATLTVPLYQSGVVYSRLREARQQVIEQRRLIDEARRQAEETASKAWDDLDTARARLDSFRSQIKANEVALDGVEREAEVGARTVLDILDAEQELLDSKVSFVRAQRDEIVAIFDLAAALGRLTAAQLNLPVDFYDAERHYREVRDKWVGFQSSGDSDEK